MTDCEWIVCERTGRWAAALRVALDRQTPRPARQPLIEEVRSLNELTQRLAQRPRALALVEVRPSNLAHALAWLADAGSQHPLARLVALLECHDVNPGMRREVWSALGAAGVVAATDSPRRLQNVLAIGRRHAAMQSGKSNRPDASQSIADWATSLLPWQTA